MFDKVVKAVTAPVKDGVSIVQGLSEGELRKAAIARLGADVVAGMATSEIVDLLQEVLENE